MEKLVVLLDGMALIYRAHFALIRSPILTRDRKNVSAMFGFANTLVDLLKEYEPSHIALALDTSEPTFRHEIFPEYKAQREEVPEDIRQAIPDVVRLAEAFRIPVLRYPGYEADDIIGTYARMADEAGLRTYMVTPDKDYAQLVTDLSFMFKPGRQGSSHQILDRATICEDWNVTEPARVADILGLMGDASDNIPGVPGVGEKTAKKLLGEYGDLENLLAHTDELKGKLKERMIEHTDLARLSRDLAVINTAVPVEAELEALARQDMDEEALKALFVEFEFNSLGKRLFGDVFKAGRGKPGPVQGDLFDQAPMHADAGDEAIAPVIELKTIETVEHEYALVRTADERAALIAQLAEQPAFCFDLESDQLNPRGAGILGLAFSWEAHRGYYAAIESPEDEAAILAEFVPLLGRDDILKIGHNLKFDLLLLAWKGVEVSGPLFDTMVAHFLVEPDRRHNMDFLAEQELGYTPVPISSMIGEKGKEQKSLRDIAVETVAEYAAEDADVTWQLYQVLAPRLKEGGQEQVFFDIEMPLIPTLVHMEREGINLDASVLADFSVELGKRIESDRLQIYELAGEEFNLNSPKQLGVILFDKLKLSEKPKKTKTGQYSTNEQVLQDLAPHHEIVRRILEYREASKLKSTYVDSLPNQLHPETGRIHTTYSQFGAATGRLASSDPNIQNIPIRSPLGKEIRKAFVPRGEGWSLLAADYSQIELRVMAQMSGDPGMRAAFESGHDIHAATAAKIYSVALDEVTQDMRRKAKMVNFGIMYGISAFGLSQRLAIPRKEASEIIDAYFQEFSSVKTFMDTTIKSCRKLGYVQTMTGRRRQIRDITSVNRTIQAGAERMAVNSPIQGTAADMIKIAMVKVKKALDDGGFKTQMLLQVHDELVFDLWDDESEAVQAVIEQAMGETVPMDVPILIEMGVGPNWLVAH